MNNFIFIRQFDWIIVWRYNARVLLYVDGFSISIIITTIMNYYL